MASKNLNTLRASRVGYSLANVEQFVCISLADRRVKFGECIASRDVWHGLALVGRHWVSKRDVESETESIL